MIDVGQHIEFLLVSHDCVVVAGIGAFLANRYPAWWDEKKNRFMPPRREIRFNPEVSHDDGLLAQSLMRRHGVAYETATQIIAQWLDEQNSQQRLEIGRLGYLVPSSIPGVTARFIPKHGHLASAFYDALPPIDIEKTQTEHAGVADAEVLQPALQRPYQWIKYAAMVAAAFCLIALVFLAPDATQTQTQHAALPPTTIQATKATPKIAPLLFIAPPPADGKGEAKPESIELPDTPGKYLVVVASTTTEKEAHRYIAEHRDSKMKYRQTGRYHRIYVASGNDYLQTHRLAQKMQQAYPGAWACPR